MSPGQTVGAILLAGIAAGALAAPALTPHDPAAQYRGYEHAPPMRLRFTNADGRPARPFVYPLRLADPLARRYAERRDAPAAIRWFRDGVVASIDETAGPWLPLGGDALGRDVLARLLYGTRLSLGVACLAAIGALALGGVIGAVAGFAGGRLDTALMALADFVLILPAIYVVLAFRATLPLVLSVPQVFAALAAVLVLAGWPVAARGVRAIVAAERRKQYVEAAYANGAGRWHILRRHLVPAAAPFLGVTGMLMVPAFVLAESTMSLVGLGFPIPTASWGTMMREAWQGGALVEAPWMMAPAVAVVLTVLSLHLITSGVGGAGGGAGTFS